LKTYLVATFVERELPVAVERSPALPVLELMCEADPVPVLDSPAEIEVVDCVLPVMDSHTEDVLLMEDDEACAATVDSAAKYLLVAAKADRLIPPVVVELLAETPALLSSEVDVVLAVETGIDVVLLVM
jgi:hypothetical protein